MEAFFDEVAHAGGKDPYELRRKPSVNQPRMLAVLDLAAKKANWGTKLAPAWVGIAAHFSFDSYVAQVIEASVEKNGEVRVHRVVCALDCGTVINPDTVKAQMEGGIIFGLTAALKTEITLKDGRVEQNNFHDYQMLRMFESPEIEVHMVPSTENPTGVGEPGVPCVAPALANAIFAATGKRVRRLPIRVVNWLSWGATGMQKFEMNRQTHNQSRNMVTTQLFLTAVVCVGAVVFATSPAGLWPSRTLPPRKQRFSRFTRF